MNDPTATLPRPDIDIGDSVYFCHPQRGHMSARVIARGVHGCTAACHLGDLYRIHWDKIIGIKEQAKKKFTLVEKGQEGCIVEDDHGQRHYIETATAELEEQQRQEKAEKKPLKKTLPDGLLLIKGQVKAHTRHSPSGKVVAVNPYINKKMKGDQGTMDLFAQKPAPAPEPAPEPTPKPRSTKTPEQQIKANIELKNAFLEYAASGYLPVNGLLRRPGSLETNPIIKEKTQDRINKMREGFALAPERELTGLWRGDSGFIAQKMIDRCEFAKPIDDLTDDDLQKMVGQQFLDRGFISTSRDKKMAIQFSYAGFIGGIKSILTFEGTAKTIDMEKIVPLPVYAEDESEKEVLLQDGRTYEVTKAIWEAPTQAGQKRRLIITLKVV